jgi:hypothetical protein
MSRQLKISEDVHFMLSLMKPFPSTSYDDVIRGMIEDACPFLPYELERIRKLEVKDPGEAAYELHELQERILQDYTVERLLRKKENDEEMASERAIAQKEREEEEEAIDRYLEKQEKNQANTQINELKKTGKIIPKRESKK